MSKYQFLPVYVDWYGRQWTYAAINQMLLYIKLRKKYNTEFVDWFMQLLNDYESYSTFQNFLKT